MMNENEIAIELQRSLAGTHQYRNASSGRGISPVMSCIQPSGAGSRSGLASASASGSNGRAIQARPVAGTTGLLYPELSYQVVGALIEVHRWLGPGQLESIYQRAVEKELALRSIPFEAQVPIQARYKGDDMGELVLDVIVDGAIVLELKAVTSLLPVHRAQVISYLHATGCRLGLLVNFHVPVMVQGIRRLAL